MQVTSKFPVWAAQAALVRAFTAALLIASLGGNGFAQDPAATPVPAPAPAPAPAATPSPAANNADTTITLNLNNVQIEQLVQFMSDTAGKPVIKQKDINVQVTVTSPTPVTRRQALDLIYDALRMDNIFVIELTDRIQIVTQEALRKLEIKSIEETDDLQAMEDSSAVAQRLYRLKHISAENLKRHLEKLVPDSAMTIDSKSNTLILTDQVTRLKRYDRVVQALDTADTTERVVEIIKLKHASAVELSVLIANIMLNNGAARPDGTPGDPSSIARAQELLGRARGGGGGRFSGREQGNSLPVIVGDLTLVPDPRTNWIIVTCPKSMLAEVTRLVQEFDRPQDADVQARFLTLRHMTATAASGVVTELFRDAVGGAAKDVIRAVPNDDGKSLVIMSSLVNFELIKGIIEELDKPGLTDRIVEIFRLEHASAIELSILIANIMMNVTPTGPGKPPAADQNTLARTQELLARSRGGSAGRYTGREQSGSLPIPVGELTLVPDPRTNWIIVTCPQAMLAEVTRLIKEFDKPQDADVQARFLPIKHMEATAAAAVISELFRDAVGGAAKDVIRAVPTDDGTNLVIMSSQINFEIIKRIVDELDNTDAEKRETRTYPVKHLPATELAEQLNRLYDDDPNSRNSNPYFFYSRSYSPGQYTKPTFVPSPRTSTIMVLARPKEYDFIERMMKELDVEVDASVFEPRVYRVRNTDANELVKILETLFQESTAGRSQADDYFWRPASNQSQSNRSMIQNLFGEIRFVVDNVTNTVVALASNPKDYAVIDSTIKTLDQPDPESLEVLVYELRYANAIELSNHINNLFSDGPVQQPQAAQPSQQQSTEENEEETASALAEAVRTVVYPWQSSGRDTRSATGEEERPINTMIGQVRVVPDSRSNKITVAAPPIYFASIRSLIEDLDRPEPQVHISTRIVEIERGKERRIGIRWTPDPSSIDPAELDNAVGALGRLGFLDTYHESGGQPFTVGQNSVGPGIGSEGVTRSLDAVTGIGNTVLAADVNLALLVQLLLKNTDAKIVSEPSITVHNNEPANLFVGSEFPFRTDSQTTDQGTVTFGIEYRPVGVKLDITPHINMDGEIVLKTLLENSKVRPGETIDGQIITNKTEFRTELEVESGQTMVVGGILVEDTFNQRRDIPILGQIPGIGWLFGKRDRAASTRELIVFITPEVLNSRLQDDELLRRMQSRLEATENGEAAAELPEGEPLEPESEPAPEPPAAGGEGEAETGAEAEAGTQGL